MLQKIKIKNIKPNPFRNVERYPIREEKVQALIQSFEATTIWPVLLGRQVGPNVEIPFGHHRKTAWERIMKPSDEIEINIMALSDTDMIKMMAHENLEEWGTTAIVEIETVAAVVQAYAAGKIELNGLPAKTNRALIRYAPSFSECSDKLSEHPYTAYSIASFLGWIYKSGEPHRKIYMALSALELIERGILTEDSFLELTSNQAENLVGESKARFEEGEREAKRLEAQAKEAKERANKAPTAQTRKLAEEQERYAQEKANKARERGATEAKTVGKHLSSGMREGRIATRDAKAQANKIVGLPKQERELRSINTAARQVTLGLDKILVDDSYREKLKALALDNVYIDPGVREMLIGALESLSERALDFARRLQPVIKNAKAESKLLQNG
jgi:hypothetical protein